MKALQKLRDRFEIEALKPAWAEGYGLSSSRADLRAGLTVGVMLIPQGMAYAVLAGVPPIYGLFASLVPLLVYPLAGTSRHMAVGINAIGMLIVAAGLAPLAEPGSARYIGLALVVTISSGLIMFGMGLARLGFLANLISRPVVVGFTSAAAFLIVGSQLGNFLGLDLERSSKLYTMVAQAFEHVPRLDPLALSMGVGSLVLIVGLRQWRKAFPAELVVVGIGAALTWLLGLSNRGLEVIGSLPSGLPHLTVPTVGLATLSDLWPTIVTLTAIHFMTIISLGRIFAARHRYTIDPNRELTAIGTSNLVGGFFQALPVAGSFSRSSVADQAGAHSPIANVFAGLLVGAALLFLTPLFSYIPMPTLAAIIILAGLGLVDIEEMRQLWRTKRSDGYIAGFTFLATLGLGVEEGILLGIVVGIGALLYRISRPHVAELGHLPATHSFKNLERFSEASVVEDILILRVEAGFSFFNAKFLRNYILKKSDDGHRRVRAVVIDGMSINYLDTTALDSLLYVVETLESWGVELHFAGLTGPVRDVVQDSVLMEHLDKDQFHRTPYHAVQHLLERWDREEGTHRLEEYETTAQKDEQEVEPTSEADLL